MNCETLRTYVGIGDLIHIKQMLDSKKLQYESIPISLNYEKIKTFKPDLKYIEFIEKLFVLLFNESPYKIQKNNFGTDVCPRILNESFNIKPDIPNLEKYFYCNSQIKTDEIIVLTKIRGLKKSFYENNIKDDFLNILKQISINNKIVLMGEKSIGDNPEYVDLKNQNNDSMVYSIYKNIIENIKIYDDYTVNELGNTSPDFNKFIHDCQRMHQAKAVISLGTGGNVSMAMACSNIICCYGGCEMFYLFNQMDKNPTKFLTNNYIDYYSKLITLI
jgi:hypothetical protein